MLRGGRARLAEGMAPRITRIYTYEGCGWRRERRAVWVVEVVHRRGLMNNRQQIHIRDYPILLLAVSSVVYKYRCPLILLETDI